MKYNKLKEVYLSFINGQRKQAVNQIDEYGLYDFWSDYEIYLKEIYQDRQLMFNIFTDAVISYHRIKAR